MELLISDFPPVKIGGSKFNEKFHSLFKSAATVNIATGYVSEKSVKFIGELIFKNGGPMCNLIIGMHYFDRFTHSQYASAIELHKFLTKNSLGSVRLVTSFPFHGKLYSFNSVKGPFASIIGSSNLNNILQHNSSRQYETDLYITEQAINKNILKFIEDLSCRSSSNISDLEITDFRETNDLFNDLAGVVKLEGYRLELLKKEIISSITFEIPLTPYELAPKSNINAYFGKGRKSNRGIIKSRPWYEAEIIVPKHIVELPNYPKPFFGEKDRNLTVFTDDGYEFTCIINGSGWKNFRSTKDCGGLTTLGKWIKGRLEQAGALSMGEPITKNTLKKYGRDSFSLQATNDPNLWFLDFSRKY